MKLHGLLGLCIAALAGSGAVWSQAPSPPTGDGLVPIRSWNLDEIYLRPNVDLASYRKVVIDTRLRNRRRARPRRTASVPERHQPLR